MLHQHTTHPFPFNRIGLHQLLQRFDAGLSLSAIRRLPAATRAWLMYRFMRKL